MILWIEGPFPLPAMMLPGQCLNFFHYHYKDIHHHHHHHPHHHQHQGWGQQWIGDEYVWPVRQISLQSITPAPAPSSRISKKYKNIRKQDWIYVQLVLDEVLTCFPFLLIPTDWDQSNRPPAHMILPTYKNIWNLIFRGFHQGDGVLPFFQYSWLYYVSNVMNSTLKQSLKCRGLH